MESYEKLELEGRYDVVRGFAAGWGAGRGWSREEVAHRIVWPEDWNIQVDSRMQELVDVIVPEKDCVVLVRSDTIDAFLEALAPFERRLTLSLKSRRPIESASFKFSFTFYSRQEAATVRLIFENLPDGVGVSDDYEPVEHSDASAAGTELYAPVHAYTFAGHGTVSGDLRGVLTVSERASQHERIKRKAVQLQLSS